MTGPNCTETAAAADTHVRLNLFVSYAHEDEDLRKRFDTTLAVLHAHGFIEAWTDRNLLGGDDFLVEIEAAINRSKIIVFLVSASFLASKFIRTKEMP